VPNRTRTGLFLGEGSSDVPLAELVEQLFYDRDVPLRLSKPDFARLPDRVGCTLERKVEKGLELLGGPVEVIVIHREADNAGPEHRLREMREALDRTFCGAELVPVIPVRMTEAWLLLDEKAIRTVAGNPKGRHPLGLPAPSEVERKSDPKEILRKALLDASGTTGRRRASVEKRFANHRRDLLGRLDRFGPVTGLGSWWRLVEGVEGVIGGLG
jgi:hypothetical protein